MPMISRGEVRIAGTSVLDVRPEIPSPLDELIYEATSSALAVAGIPLTSIDGVCIAASDLLDGRGISTMTLSGSTGSFQKAELRTCSDALAAIGIAVAEMLGGAQERMLVVAWSKLSDTALDAISPLCLEPAFHRPLTFHPDAVFQLRESYNRGVPTVTFGTNAVPADTAAAAVLTLNREEAGSHSPAIVGFGSWTGHYLGPSDAVTDSLVAAVEGALATADKDRDEIGQVYLADLGALEDDRIRRVLGLPGASISRVEPQEADVGYAAGLLALVEAASQADQGLVLVASAGGPGLQSANAVLVEVA